jgi:hypothetical protein
MTSFLEGLFSLVGGKTNFILYAAIGIVFLAGAFTIKFLFGELQDRTEELGKVQAANSQNLKTIDKLSSDLAELDKLLSALADTHEQIQKDAQKDEATLLGKGVNSEKVSLWRDVPLPDDIARVFNPSSGGTDSNSDVETAKRNNKDD